MSTDLAAQIRDYAQVVDAAQAPLTLDELRHVRVGEDPVRPVALRQDKPIQRERDTGSRTSSRSTQAWVSAAAAAAVLLLLVGGAAWLLRSNQAEQPAITTPMVPTTIAPTTIPPSEGLGPSNVVPGLGTLSWQRYDGDRDSLPPGIDNGPSGGFVFPRRGWLGDDRRTWESDDGLVWEASTLPEALAGYRSLSVDGNWARASGRSSPETSSALDGHIYFRDGNRWELLELIDVPVPATTGITWEQGTTRTPIEHNGVTFITGSLWGTIDLETVYFDSMTTWDPIAEQLMVTMGSTGDLLARLEMAVVDNRIEFTDELSGPEVVFTVEGAADFTVEMIADRLMSNESLGASYGWVAGPDRDFDLVDVPWNTPDAQVFIAPSGGFAAYNFEPQTWYAHDDFEMVASVWTSPDGVTWQDHGVPEFVVPESTEAAWIGSAGDNRLWATRVDASALEETELWTSADGVSWQLIGRFPFDEEPKVYEADFGFVAIDAADEYLVSADGLTFHPVTGPPLDDLDRWLFEPSFGAAGDFLYAIGRPCATEPTRTCSNSATDARVLWIGRLSENP